jgi:hypothetical protein
MAFPKFASAKWIRSRVRVRWETRPTKIADFPDDWEEYVADPATWNAANKNYQATTLDKTIMRRYVLEIVAIKECDTATVTSAALEEFLNNEEGTLPNIYFKNGNIMDLSGNWLPENIDVDDLQNGKTRVAGQWRKLGDWDMYTKE